MHSDASGARRIDDGFGRQGGGRGCEFQDIASGTSGFISSSTPQLYSAVCDPTGEFCTESGESAENIRVDWSGPEIVVVWHPHRGRGLCWLIECTMVERRNSMYRKSVVLLALIGICLTAGAAGAAQLVVKVNFQLAAAQVAGRLSAGFRVGLWRPRQRLQLRLEPRHLRRLARAQQRRLQGQALRYVGSFPERGRGNLGNRHSERQVQCLPGLRRRRATRTRRTPWMWKACVHRSRRAGQLRRVHRHGGGHRRSSDGQAGHGRRQRQDLLHRHHPGDAQARQWIRCRRTRRRIFRGTWFLPGRAGQSAEKHNVYLGTDFADVNNAATRSAEVWSAGPDRHDVRAGQRFAYRPDLLLAGR